MSASPDLAADDAQRRYEGGIGIPSLPVNMTVELARRYERVGLVDFTRCVDVQLHSSAWHDERNKRITASQAAAVFPGVSITMSTGELHAKLRGQAPRPLNTHAQAAADEGNRMEPVLIAELKRLMPQRVFIPSAFFVAPSDLIDLGASPDAIIVDGGIVVEIKWRLNEPAWHGDLGHTVFTQVQLQMHVTGARTAYVYCGCRSGDRSLWLVLYSPSFIQMWTSWKNKAVVLASQYETRPRAEVGTYDQCSMFIQLELQHHSARIEVPACPQYPQHHPPPL